MLGVLRSDGATARCETLQPCVCCPVLNVPAVRSKAPNRAERPHGLLPHRASAGPVLLLLASRACTLPQGLVPTVCGSMGAGPREQALDRSTFPDTCLKGPATKQFEEALRLKEEPAACDCCAYCDSCNGTTRLPRGVGAPPLWSGLWLRSKGIAGLEWRPPRAAGLVERPGAGGCTSW